MEQLQKTLDQLMTAGQVRQSFQKPISAMTLHLWRRNKGLPTIVIPGDSRPAIRFLPAQVAEWARGEGIKIKPVLRRKRS